jgi:tetratricopeptide (TPR) repeat protein
MRLNPRYPVFYLEILGSAYLVMGRCEEAIAIQKRALTKNPNSMSAHLTLVICYVESSREAEARIEAAEVLQISPNFSVDRWRQNASIKDPAVVERAVAGMRKAGLK